MGLPWRVGLPLEGGSHPGGSPLEGGSPPGGWVSPWWVSTGWVSPWRVSVAALLRNGQAHVQISGAQPGKDSLGLEGAPASHAQTPTLTQEGKEMQGAKCSLCVTFHVKLSFGTNSSSGHSRRRLTQQTAVWGQRPWVFCGYRRPAGWAARPLVGGTLLYIQT